MQLRHIIAATDDSPEGMTAVRTAAGLAQRSHARVTVVTVVPIQRRPDDLEADRVGLATRVKSALRQLVPAPKVEVAVVQGLPGVEISRIAETGGGDLVVLGRKHRSEMHRLLVGDTADSVARRCGTPCLFVSSREQRFDRILVALDGTERGFPVLIAATEFARITGAKVRVVSVEPAYQNEAGVDRLLTGRSARLVEAVDQRMHTSDLGEGGRDRCRSGGANAPVVIHRGPVVAEIMAEIRSCSADVLFLGYHRGGPAAVIDAGSVARRLLHEAPCGVITIPL